jgi:hypothetical protein
MNEYDVTEEEMEIFKLNIPQWTPCTKGCLRVHCKPKHDDIRCRECCIEARG